MLTLANMQMITTDWASVCLGFGFHFLACDSFPDYIFTSVSYSSRSQHANGDNIKMKAAKKQARRGENPADEITVKTEYEPEQEAEGDEGGSQYVYTNGDGLNIQIKEEPDSQEISEEHSRDTSSYSDINGDTVTSGSDCQGHIKDECNYDHCSEYDFTEAAVKEESDSWIKEEGDSDEEVDDAGDIQDEFEEEEVCTGSIKVLNMRSVENQCFSTCDLYCFFIV